MAGVDGLISGINTSAIINQIMEAARSPIRAYQRQIDGLNSRRGKLQELNTLLADLKTALGAVDEMTELPAYKVTSSQPDMLGVSATGDASPGTHSVRVHYTALATIKRSNGMTSPTQTLKKGNLEITIDGDVTNVPIKDSEGTRNIAGIADYINENVEGASAYVLDTGSSSAPYRLMVTGDETGMSNQVDTSVTYSGGGGKKLTMSTQQSARNARLTVDGLTVYRESNTPNDIIPGLEFDIKAPTSGNATITVGRDTEQMVANVQTVVDAYNKLNEYFDANIGIDADASIAGDPTVRTVQRRLQMSLASGYGNSSLAGLNSIGLGTAQDGTLEFDSAEFTSKVGSNFDSVLSMLSGASGLFEDMYEVVDAVVDPLTGIIQPRIESIDDQVDSLLDKTTDAEYRLEQYEAMLRSQFTAMESMLAKYQATGDYITAQLATGLPGFTKNG